MTITAEIMEMEEKLRQAELGPDAAFFDSVLDANALLDGEKMRDKVIAAHQPGGPAKFSAVEMRDFSVIEHAPFGAVVTCSGDYTGDKGRFTLKFMRVWLKKDGHWKIVAGTTR